MADQAASIFNADGTPQGTTGGTGTPPNTPNNDPLATLLGEIKNERGEPKYKTVQDALNALKHSQEYIPTLKQTKDELEAQLQAVSAKAAKVDALELVVQELTQKMSTSQQTPAAGLSEEQVAELVNRTLSKTQTEAIQRSNTTSVVTALKASFGDKAEEVFYKKAQELGLSVAEFNAMAAKTPKAVLELVGVRSNGDPMRSNTSTVNTAGFQPKQDSSIGRNAKTALLGATTQDLRDESANASKMVDELHSQGLTVHDLTDPKVYFKLFK
jgi:hypothetical protein